MFDIKSKRTFLRRTPIENLALSDMVVGGSVTIFARILKITGYTDQRTKEILTSKRQILTITMNAAGYELAGSLFSGVAMAGLAISKCRLIDSNGPTIVTEIVGDNASEVMEKTCSSMSWWKYATVDLASQSHPCFSDTGRYPETAAYDNCALCIIRPHAVKAGNVGNIITSIMASGMEMTALKMIHLSRSESHELFEVYKGVLPYYSEIITEMISAPCIFMEIRSASVIEDLRRLSGPHDVELAQHIMPDSLRAKYGMSNSKNGVHVTDLASDGELEVRYVFEILGRVC
jgi:nucleoside-diphosphate kinase